MEVKSPTDLGAQARRAAAGVTRLNDDSCCSRAPLFAAGCLLCLTAPALTTPINKHTGSAPMVAPFERAWASGDEVDVLREDGQWWPGAIVGPDDGDAASYRVRVQGSTGGLQPPHGCGAPAAQEERGVTPGQLVPAGQHVPRWRLCGREELVEVKVRRQSSRFGRSWGGGGGPAATAL